MAKVRQRSWPVPGKWTKRRAWGFVTVAPGEHRSDCAGGLCSGCRQVRQFKTEWTREDAEKALAAFQLKIEQPKAKPTGMTLAQAFDRYVALKARKKSLAGDEKIIKHLTAEFGAETPISALTADRISEYKAKRLRAVRKVGTGETAKVRPITAAAVTRPLALLRHLLTLAHEEWGVLDTVPRIKLEQEPKGRLRWLKPEEAAKLLAACREGKNKALADVVEFTAFTGLRQGEALGLTWDRVDRARGVVRLEETKSDRRRDVPLNGNADAVLARRWAEGVKGYVFGSRKWDSFRSAWDLAVQRAGLVDNVTFHTLRHTFASWLMQRGRTLLEVQDALGHQTVAMTVRYAHLAPDHLRAAVASLDDILPPAPAVTAEGQPADEPRKFSHMGAHMSREKQNGHPG